MDAAAPNQVNNDLEEEELEPDPETCDNVGDVSVEINVEALVEQIELESELGKLGEMSARRRLEELMEARRAAMDNADFDDYDL